jgi:hypothetical protein
MVPLISLASVSLLPCSADPGPATASIVVDLVRDPPVQIAITTTLHEYCGVRLHFAPTAPGSDVPSELVGRSIVLSGKRAYGIAFEIASGTQRTIDLQSTGPAAHLATRSLVLSFDLITWLRGLGLDRAVRNPQGVVVVDSQTQPSLVAIFDEQSAAAATLHDDANENGRLDPSELTAIAAALSSGNDAGFVSMDAGE